eukprot:TRINITY_DN11420_c0_g1_i1.p1 TRINITY_DN11420_c0_g1~~TRINITY_DN11420_c0_g1_i1.p1  ORF type:complete len:199 (+),score=29.49 TRINITY_DN11420_c0_g1_i1:166-762(+)
MSKILKFLKPEVSQYRDRRFEGNQQEFDQLLRTSSTVYLGNLSFFTTEEQIYEVFGKVGRIKRIIMGLDKYKRTPCGFCFVVFYTRQAAEAAVKYLSGTVLDERSIRVDIDWGFREGRQYGRGRSGGQVRDEYRTDYDQDRGGYGKVVAAELAMRFGPSEADQEGGVGVNGDGEAQQPPQPHRNPRARDEDDVDEMQQ